MLQNLRLKRVAMRKKAKVTLERIGKPNLTIEVKVIKVKTRDAKFEIQIDDESNEIIIRCVESFGSRLIVFPEVANVIRVRAN